MKASSKEKTRTEPFHVGPGEVVEVRMMNDVSPTMAHGSLDGGSFQALELLCGSRGGFAMVVLLPRGGSGLPELEATPTPEARQS